MQHVFEERMIEVLLDGNAFSDEERDHLSICAQCQNQFAMLTQISQGFEVAKLSQLRPEQEERLVSIFHQIEHDITAKQALPRLIKIMKGWVSALPLFDSRQQVAALGVRSANQSSYRMLFGTDETEIELMVEPQNGFLRVMGEVMVTEDNGANGMALIELATSTDARTTIETESDASGRFALDEVPPGIYLMTITPRFSQMVVIEALELT